MTSRSPSPIPQPRSLEPYHSLLTTKLNSPQCDLTRPNCERCRKAGIQCRYDEHRNFVKASPSSSDGAETVLFNVQTLSLEDHPRIPDLTLLPNYLHNSTCHEQHYQLALDVLLPGGKPSPQCQARFPLNSWIFIAHKFYGEHAALRKSIAAITLSGLGRRDGKPELMKLGLKLYVEALGEVRQNLLAIYGHDSGALVVAARCLASYEVLYGAETEKQKGLSQVKSWHGHNLGEVALLTSRPATVFAIGRDHQIFVDGRMQLTITACTTRKRTFLNDQQWRTVPWSVKPKTSRDLLIDILIQIPPILEDYDALKKSPPSAPPAEGAASHTAGAIAWCKASCSSLLEECSRVEAELATWWDNHAPHASYEGLRARGFVRPTTDELVFTHFLTVYWTACVFLYNTMRMLRLMLQQDDLGATGTAGNGSVETRFNAEEMDNITPARIQQAQELAYQQKVPNSAALHNIHEKAAAPADANKDDDNFSKGPSFSQLLDPRHPYTYCNHIAEAMEAFFQPEAGTFGAFNAPFPMGASFGYLISCGDDKGMGSPVWNKTVGYFGRGEVGKALELFLLGHLTQWQEVAR
ncbi:uncharacterized protein B0I36DRAFT_367382 [Microdochium trichocladiopsis]|uniref:Zn(2)-C6 fungal-type domain-containing protein n=1 Tax=Microdochium trichocladiopsis TaxID=1682393 RepID=A0A9P9BK80_9PEZI|nr:uncharacterized protein B0I36DRAFT_367382 [Microdochium trichocladiopsis]KAH7020906.1 hypothetical protein B0I36DRAFT_367382 [Microdochium trichocladiopsis]